MDEAKYDAFQVLEREMEAFKVQIKAEHEAAEAIRKEAAANAAVERARQIAQEQRARDLQQLEALKRKLGQS